LPFHPFPCKPCAFRKKGNLAGLKRESGCSLDSRFFYIIQQQWRAQPAQGCSSPRNHLPTKSAKIIPLIFQPPVYVLTDLFFLVYQY
jgi:hypothetical protein